MKKISHPHKVCLHQMVSWKIKWLQQMEQHGKACLPTSPSQALPHATSLYPDIRVLLLVLCTLPVTSCSSERSFSTLKRIKTYLRSTCGNERLTSLALMHIHRDVPVSSQEMVDKFARLHPRRLKLMNMDLHFVTQLSVHSMIPNVSATLCISNLGPSITNMSQSKTYCFFIHFERFT